MAAPTAAPTGPAPSPANAPAAAAAPAPANLLEVVRAQVGPLPLLQPS